MEIYTASHEPLVHTIRWIMSKLPNKEYSKDLVLIDARIMFVRSGGRSAQDLSTIEYLIKRAPQCWGTHRAKVYWKIIFQHLSQAEALKLYLRQFPNRLSDAQQYQLFRYVRLVFSLPPDQIEQTLMARKFSVYRQHKRRTSATGCC